MQRRDALVGAGALTVGMAFPRAAVATTSPSAWMPLFDGKSLEGWAFYQEGIGTTDIRSAVAIENGVLHFLGPRYRNADAPPGTSRPSVNSRIIISALSAAGARDAGRRACSSGGTARSSTTWANDATACFRIAWNFRSRKATSAMR